MYNRKDYYVRLYHDNPSHKVFCQSEKLRVAHRVALDAQEPPDYNDCDWTTVLQQTQQCKSKLLILGPLLLTTHDDVIIDPTTNKTYLTTGSVLIDLLVVTDIIYSWHKYFFGIVFLIPILSYRTFLILFFV